MTKAAIQADIDKHLRLQPARKAMTALTEPQLVQLRAKAYLSTDSRFVDPAVIAQCERVLDRRGEVWAADVCGRDLRERARLRIINRPALRDHEPLLLVLADQAEDKAVIDAIG